MVDGSGEWGKADRQSISIYAHETSWEYSILTPNPNTDSNPTTLLLGTTILKKRNFWVDSGTSCSRMGCDQDIDGGSMWNFVIGCSAGQRPYNGRCLAWQCHGSCDLACLISEKRQISMQYQLAYSKALRKAIVLNTCPAFVSVAHYLGLPGGRCLSLMRADRGPLRTGLTDFYDFKSIVNNSPSLICCLPCYLGR